MQGIDLKKFVLEENVRRLEPEQVQPYLSDLDKRLSELAQILTGEDDGFVAPYLQVIKETIECLKLKHDLDEEKVNFSLTIDPTDSGFPTPKDLYLLEKDKELAEKTLAILPPREKLIEKIRADVMRKRSPKNSQILLKRRKYYSRLLETNLLKEYHLNEPKLVKEDSRKRSYTLEWSCLERGWNVPIFYRMYLTQDKWDAPLHERQNDSLRTHLYKCQMGMTDLRSLVRTIDQELHEIHPKMIYKYIFGPYYNNLTKNHGELDALLGEDESVIKFRVEAVASRMARKFTTIFRMLTGKSTIKEIYGPLDDCDKRMIVPFRVKQKLGDRDEYGQPCKIYAVTQEGGIIG